MMRLSEPSPAPGSRRQSPLILTAIPLLLLLAGVARAAEEPVPDALPLPEGAPAEPAPAPDDGKAVRSLGLHVDAATFGRGIHPCDVTALVRSQCEGKPSCVVDTAATLCPREHRLPGIIEPLKVDYRCRVGSGQLSATVEEPGRLRLVCR